MATEMPIEQDYQRFIDGVSEPAEDGSVTVDFPEDDMDIEELPDGSAIVTTDDYSGPEEDEDFYQNLAEVFDPYELNRIAMHYIDLVAVDRKLPKISLLLLKGL